MIYYMNHTLEDSAKFWRPVPSNFQPIDIMSDKMWIKIGDTVYLDWSEEFEQAVMWEMLTE